jgi:hypothetical protein
MPGTTRVVVGEIAILFKSKGSEMLKNVMLLAVLMSACTTDPADNTDQSAGSAEPGSQASDGKPGECKRAQELGYGDAAVQSCQAGAPINGEGVVAEPSDKAFFAQCNTYYGGCSGVNGCSRAVGEGWELTNCGSFLYSWMTICDGEPSSWGTGFCLF